MLAGNAPAESTAGAEADAEADVKFNMNTRCPVEENGDLSCVAPRHTSRIAARNAGA